jgi:DNA invertase Pin-like site-specific DNA recombinase
VVWDNGGAALPSSVAKVEAQKTGERIKAGMARAKAKGIKIGRPKLGIELRQKIAQRAAKRNRPIPSPRTLVSAGTPQRNTRAELSQFHQFVDRYIVGRNG